MTALQTDLLKTILYYDIFHYPLKAEEIFSFLPSNSVTLDTIIRALNESVERDFILRSGEFYSVDQDIAALVTRRLEMQSFAERRWTIAYIVGGIIKRFPFVRACFITGTLAKHISSPDCDIDFFVVTEKNRLWICRTSLILFKKIFLLNSKKYFCLNYFVAEDALEIYDRNVFTATEIAHAKPLISSFHFNEFLSRNSWISSYFPNWNVRQMKLSRADDRSSLMRRLFEIPFLGRWADRLDTLLMEKMKYIWKQRYPELTDEKRDELFRVRKSVSKAHGPDFATKVMTLYKSKCLAYGIDDSGN
jgi:hypothetical protein